MVMSSLVMWPRPTGLLWRGNILVFGPDGGVRVVVGRVCWGMAERYSVDEGAAVLGSVERLVPEVGSAAVPGLAGGVGHSAVVGVFVGEWAHHQEQTVRRAEELELAGRLVAAMMAGVHARLAG